MKSLLTPQQKKQYSLDRDCRNCYGNNDKAARKCIPRRRARTHRNYRHAIRQVILRELYCEVDAAETIENATAGICRKMWKKWNDIPLRKILRKKVERE